MRGRLRAVLQRLHVLPALSGPLDDRVLDGARIRAGDTVADVGVGVLTVGAVERVGTDGDVLAIDRSVDVLEKLRAGVTAPNVSYFVGRADVLPLMDESVDVVLTRGVDDEAEVAHELFRVLKSGGRISICGGSGDSIVERVFTSAGFDDVRTDTAGSAVYLTAVKP